MVKLPTLKALKKNLRDHFNRFIRLRDIAKGCISCGRHYSEMCGAWQAGHWYPSATCTPSMDFDEMNVHGQCAYCNLNEGNRQGYREGLVRRYGEKILEELEIKRAASRRCYWGIWEYNAMIVKYRAKVKQYENNTLV